MVTGHLCRGEAVQRESPERLPGRGPEIGLDDRQQPLEDVMIMVPLLLAGQVAGRCFQSVEKSDGRVEPDGRPPGSSAVPRPLDLDPNGHYTGRIARLPRCVTAGEKT
jgi:hypothetical protein